MLSRRHVNNPHVAFTVKQQYPKRLEEVVCSTLEVESCLVKPVTTASIVQREIRVMGSRDGCHRMYARDI